MLYEEKHLQYKVLQVLYKCLPFPSGTSVIPLESPSDPSGVFLKMLVIWCYKLYFRVVSSS
mgnify:CR=1 FL=1